jgi:hypothetical protein
MERAREQKYESTSAHVPAQEAAATRQVTEQPQRAEGVSALHRINRFSAIPAASGQRRNHACGLPPVGRVVETRQTLGCRLSRVEDEPPPSQAFTGNLHCDGGLRRRFERKVVEEVSEKVALT